MAQIPKYVEQTTSHQVAEVTDHLDPMDLNCRIKEAIELIDTMWSEIVSLRNDIVVLKEYVEDRENLLEEFL